MKPGQQKRKKYLDPGTVIIIKQVFSGLLVFTAVGIVLTSIWYGTRLLTFTIDKVTVVGGITIDKEKIRVEAEDKLNGAYLHLIPRRFIYFYPKQEILAEISKTERIKNVIIKKNSKREIGVYFEEYFPDNLWCNLGSVEGCYFLDKEGYSFAPAPKLVGESLVRYYSTENETKVGVNPFSQADYSTTREFTEKLAEIGWFVTKVEVDSARDAFYTISLGSELKTTLTEDAVKPFSNLETILQSKEFNHLKPGNFRYIDLRFGTRVFVNESLEGEGSENASTTAVSAE